MIINGFGSSGSSGGLANERNWSPIITYTLSNYSLSRISTGGTVNDGTGIAYSTNYNDYDWEVLEGSLAIKAVVNSWSFGGSYTASSSTSTLRFSINGGKDQSRYPALFMRTYQGILSTTGLSIETIRNEEQNSYNYIMPLCRVYDEYSTYSQKQVRQYNFNTDASNFNTWAGLLFSKYTDGSGVSTYPVFYGYYRSSNLANLTLTCSITIKGYTG